MTFTEEQRRYIQLYGQVWESFGKFIGGASEFSRRSFLQNYLQYQQEVPIQIRSALPGSNNLEAQFNLLAPKEWGEDMKQVKKVALKRSPSRKNPIKGEKPRNPFKK